MESIKTDQSSWIEFVAKMIAMKQSLHLRRLHLLSLPNSEWVDADESLQTRETTFDTDSAP